MRVFRTLAFWLGRALARLARALLSWGRRPGEVPVDPGDWAPAPEEGPPEHWLRYIRQRSPWLARGMRPAPPAYPGRPAGARPERRDPPSDGRRASPLRASGAPLEEGTHTEARQQGTGIEPADAAFGSAGRPTGAMPAETASAGSRPLVLEPKLAPRPVRRVAIRPADVLPVVTPPATRPGGPAEARRDDGPAVRHGTSRMRALRAVPTAIVEAPRPEWPRLPLEDREGRARRGQEAGTAEARAAGLPGAARAAERSAIPAPSPEADEAPRATDAAQREVEAQEGIPWPELPDTGWRGAAWQVPSSRLLEREQLRLTRLRAEQAGSSWSGPRF